MKTTMMMKSAIKDSKVNMVKDGYKWTADAKGLHWSYGADFDFEMGCENGHDFVRFIDRQTDVCVIVFLVRGADKWLVDDYDFFNKAERAIYMAAYRMIKKACNLY